MAAMIRQPLRIKVGSLPRDAVPGTILLAMAMAAKPHTALPSVNSVGIMAMRFTIPLAPWVRFVSSGFTSEYPKDTDHGKNLPAFRWENNPSGLCGLGRTWGSPRLFW